MLLRGIVPDVNDVIRRISELPGRAVTVWFPLRCGTLPVVLIGVVETHSDLQTLDVSQGSEAANSLLSRHNIKAVLDSLYTVGRARLSSGSITTSDTGPACVKSACVETDI